MAASSMKDIKLRIKSVESTMQITKAMELVASSKLRRAKERAEETRPYFTTLHECLTDIAYGNTDFSSPFVQQREVKKTCYIMIAGDRGLTGGYNTNLFKTVAEHMDGKVVCVLPIGKKAVEYCAHRGLETVTDAYATAEDVSLGDCFSIARMLCGQFRKGAFDALYVGYTNFVSMLSQQPAMLALFMLAANVFWGLQGAAIPAVVQHHAPREAVGSAYGIINGIGNICAAFIPLLMGVVMKSVGSVSSGFSVLVASQLITLCAGGALLLRMRRAAAVNASIP